MREEILRQTREVVGEAGEEGWGVQMVECVG